MRWLFLISVLAALPGCVTLPPRYIEPSLPVDQLAVIVTKGDGIGVLSVDGAIACPAADYTLAGLKRTSPGNTVNLVPGTHDVTFACWGAYGSLNLATNLTVSAGERYRVARHLVGYSVSLSVQLEK